MPAKRIVSFLPAATEMVYALGLGDRLAGRSHECSYPPEALDKPVVSHPNLPVEQMAPDEIDRAVSAQLAAGASLYRIDVGRLEEIAPDLILTQDLCQVCAPSGNDVTAILQSLPGRPLVLYFSPSTLAEVWQNILDLGDAAGVGPGARELVAGLKDRLESVRRRTGGAGVRPRVVVLEWLDPLYTAGHWVPEMVELAGGINGISEPGSHSKRVSWEQVREWSPDTLVLAPCGYNAAQAAAQVDLVRRLPGCPRTIHAVDASAYFACPGPRLVEGTELLAQLFHPDQAAWNGAADAWTTIRL